MALQLALPLRAGCGQGCNQQRKGPDTKPGTHSRLSCACERSHVLALAPHLNSKSSQNSPSWNSCGKMVRSFFTASPKVVLVTCRKQVLAPGAAWKKAGHGSD